MNKEDFESNLFYMFVASAIQQGSAISDREHITTVGSLAEGLPPVVHVINKMDPQGTPVVIDACKGSSAHERAAQFWLIKKFGKHDDVVFHESYDTSSPGVTWKWFKNHTIVPMVVCTDGSMHRFISKMENRVAEAAAVESRLTPEINNEESVHGESDSGNKSQQG